MTDRGHPGYSSNSQSGQVTRYHFNLLRSHLGLLRKQVSVEIVVFVRFQCSCERVPGGAHLRRVQRADQGQCLGIRTREGDSSLTQ